MAEKDVSSPANTCYIAGQDVWIRPRGHKRRSRGVYKEREIENQKHIVSSGNFYWSLDDDQVEAI